MTPGSPGPTLTLQPGTATIPGATPPPSVTASLPGTDTPSAPVTAALSPLPVEPTGGVVLTCSAKVSRQATLPGEAVEYTILVSNVGPGPANNVALQDLISPDIDLLRISATQGVVDVNAGLMVLRLGIIEAGQSVLAILELKTSPDAVAGLVFVQQAAVFSDESQTMCNAVAFGTRPDHLPATGAERGEP
jgi:uncharacterized repeat protein (TIGR01451 family)